MMKRRERNNPIADAPAHAVAFGSLETHFLLIHRNDIRLVTDSADTGSTNPSSLRLMNWNTYQRRRNSRSYHPIWLKEKN
jgi:hypothetical protein